MANIDIYSKSRGLKELDLLLGNWADENIDTLTNDELNDLSEILKVETLDLVNYLMKRDITPEYLLSNQVYQKISQWRDIGNITSYDKS